MFWIPPHLLFALVTMIWEKLLPLLPQLTLLGNIFPPTNVTSSVRPSLLTYLATLKCEHTHGQD